MNTKRITLFKRNYTDKIRRKFLTIAITGVYKVVPITERESDNAERRTPPDISKSNNPYNISTFTCYTSRNPFFKGKPPACQLKYGRCVVCLEGGGVP